MRLQHAGGALCHQTLQIDTIYQVDRIQHIALGFGHLLAFAVAHETVYIHGFEGYLIA